MPPRAHVRVAEPGVAFTPPPPPPWASPHDDETTAPTPAFYDDASGVVLVKNNLGLRCHPLPPPRSSSIDSRLSSSESLPAEEPYDIAIAPGEVLDARLSPAPGGDARRIGNDSDDDDDDDDDDAPARVHPPRVVAVQRSPTTIEIAPARIVDASYVVEAPPGQTHVVTRAAEKGETIVSFFWVRNVPGVDFVVVTTLGVEQHKLVADGGGDRESESEFDFGPRLVLVSEKKKPGGRVAWCVYSRAASTLVVAVAGSKKVVVAASRFTSAGVVKLPKFDLPLEEGDADGGLLDARCARLVAARGRLFLCVVGAAAGLARVYRVFADAFVLTATISLKPFGLGRYEGQSARADAASVAVSVVDDALVVHALDAGVSAVYDIVGRRVADADAAAAAPAAFSLPASWEVPRGESAPVDAAEAPLEPIAPPLPLGGVDRQLRCDRAWKFYGDDVVMHPRGGRAWRAWLDLAALTDSCSRRSDVVAFLQSRAEVSGGFPADGPKALTLRALREMVTDSSLDVTEARRAFKITCDAYGEAARRVFERRGARGGDDDDASTSTSFALPSTSPAVSPGEMLSEVFAPMAKEALEASRGGDGDGDGDAKRAESGQRAALALRRSIVDFLLALDESAAREVADADGCVEKLERLRESLPSPVSGAGEPHQLPWRSREA